MILLMILLWWLVCVVGWINVDDTGGGMGIGLWAMGLLVWDWICDRWGA